MNLNFTQEQIEIGALALLILLSVIVVIFLLRRSRGEKRPQPRKQAKNLEKRLRMDQIHNLRTKLWDTKPRSAEEQKIIALALEMKLSLEEQDEFCWLSDESVRPAIREMKFISNTRKSYQSSG